MCCMQKQTTSPSLVAVLPNKFGSAVVKLLHFHPRVCFLPIPCNTGMLKVWSLFFLTSAAVQGSAVARKWYFGPNQVSTPTDSRLLQQGDTHSLFPLGSVFHWRVHGNFTAKFSKRSVRAPFCFFCELMTCLYFAHPGEHAYKCSSCSFSTMTISQLKEHSLKVHGKALTLPRPRIVNLAASHAHHTSKNHTPAEEVEDSNGKRCLRARI